MRRFHIIRFYAVIEKGDLDKFNSSYTDVVFSQNLGITKLPVADPAQHVRNVAAAAWLPGTTLWLDHPFNSYPDNIGHWLELLIPTYSGLAQGKWKVQAPHLKPHISTVVFPNLGRSQAQVCARMLHTPSHASSMPGFMFSRTAAK